MANEFFHLPEEGKLDSLLVHPSSEPHTDPEKLWPEEFERTTGLFSKGGLVTKERNLPFSDAERPIRERAWRAEEYRRLFYVGNSIANKLRIVLGKTPKRPSVEDRRWMAERGIGPVGYDNAKRKESVEAKRERGEVIRGYLMQGKIDLEFEDLGKMGATYTVVNPPAGKEQTDKPTIVFVSPLSNAAASIAQDVDQLALSGRKVVVLPQPESTSGGVNERFAEAVAASEDFTPHARYFRALIDGLAESEVPELKEKFELWAYSAGCPEMARALTDPEFSKRVESAVFVAPASSADVPKVEARAGLAFLGMLARFAPKTPIAWGSKEPETKESGKLREKVKRVLGKQLSKRTDLWERMSVGDGSPGKITVVTYDKDDVTDCAKGFAADKLLPNPQMQLIALKGGHMTPSMPEGAEELIRAVNRAKEA